MRQPYSNCPTLVNFQTISAVFFGVSRFTHFKLTPRVCIADAGGETLAHSVLAKAKKVCLVTNSLSAECELAPVVLTCCTA